MSNLELDFTSRCTPSGAHDGDTFYAPFVDLGYGHRQYPLAGTHIAIRLAGSNARELADPGGSEARAALAEMLAQSTTGYVWLRTIKPDEFRDRIDAYPYLPGRHRRRTDPHRPAVARTVEPARHQACAAVAPHRHLTPTAP